MEPVSSSRLLRPAPAAAPSPNPAATIAGRTNPPSPTVAAPIAVTPRLVAPASPLAFRAWTPATPLTPDRYGIPTPATGDWLQPDLLLLPLNAFDGAGYRLGYGGGFFDRTLATLKPRPGAVGVGFEINRVDSIEPEAHDERLDWIVTEAGLWQITR